MDFTEIYETIAPYFASGSLVTVLGVIIGIIVKVRGALNEVKTNTDIKDIFKQALPKELTVSVAKLTETEINKLTAEIRGSFISAVNANTLLVEDLAKAICSLRSIPDSLKEDIYAHCHGAKSTEQATVTVELNTELAKELPVAQTANKIFVE